MERTDVTELLNNPTAFQAGDAALVRRGSLPAVVTLGNAAVRNVGAASGTVAAGDDVRLVPSIQDFEPTIDLTGATDNSTQVIAAHTAAVAAGHRVVLVPGPILCPTAERIGDVAWVGPGRFVGNARRVVPRNAPSPLIQHNDLIPAIHYPQFLARLAAASPASPVKVVWVSDSWGELRQGVSGADWMIPLLRAEFDRQFGSLANRIQLIDRAVGGSNFPQWANQTMAGKPAKSWAPVTSNTMLSYLEAAAGDLYIVALGQNDWQSGGLSRTAMTGLINAIRAFTGTPEIVMGITAARPALSTGDNGLQAGQVLYDQVAWGMRSYARRNGIGILDFARWLTLLRDGEDTCMPLYEVVQSDAAITLPFTAPTAAMDFGIRLTTTGSAGAAFWATGDGVLTVTLSHRAGNVLRLDRDGATGNLAWAVDARTGAALVSRTVTGISALDGADLNLEITTRGGHLIVTSGDPLSGGALAVNALIEREAGRHAPVLSFGSGGTVGCTLARRTEGRPALYMPTMTDAEMYGVTSFGGNAAAHWTSIGAQRGIAAVLSSTRFY